MAIESKLKFTEETCSFVINALYSCSELLGIAPAIKDREGIAEVQNARLIIGIR